MAIACLRAASVAYASGTAVATAVPLAYATLAARKQAIAKMGQTRSGLIEDALIVTAGIAVVALATRAASDY